MELSPAEATWEHFPKSTMEKGPEIQFPVSNWCEHQVLGCAGLTSATYTTHSSITCVGLGRIIRNRLGLLHTRVRTHVQEPVKEEKDSGCAPHAGDRSGETADIMWPQP